MLFDKIVYGPIHSRRLGVSLGVNLMPTTHKLCTFDCIYCECGWNEPVMRPTLPTRSDVYDALEDNLKNMSSPLDVITFSGNGEPTLHPEFEGIIEDACDLRDKYCPQAKVSVLSNSTQLVRADVVRALKHADNRILKLDSAIDSTMRLIDRPVNKELTVEKIIRLLEQFEGDFTLQTCFLRGNGIDNTTESELQAWYRVVEHLRPKQVMIYVIDRATPMQGLEKIEVEKMQAIAEELKKRGTEVMISL